MKILLVCSAGVSTSLLERAMTTYADKKNIKNTIIDAKGVIVAKQSINEYDIVLLGPQIQYLVPEFKKISENTPIVVIERHAYAAADSRKIFNEIDKIVN